MSKKALNASEVKKFTDIPNVGKAMERDFLLLGLTLPTDLKKQDAFMLYQKMCQKSGVRQDPCVLDTYLSVVDFMNGAAAKPWWAYTAERKQKYKIPKYLITLSDRGLASVRKVIGGG